jgi:hypothetical protein
MSAGNIITSGTTDKLLDDPLARKSYFGEKFLSSDIRSKNSFSTHEDYGNEKGGTDKKKGSLDKSLNES